MSTHTCNNAHQRPGSRPVTNHHLALIVDRSFDSRFTTTGRARTPMARQTPAHVVYIGLETYIKGTGCYLSDHISTASLHTSESIMCFCTNKRQRDFTYGSNKSPRISADGSDNVASGSKCRPLRLASQTLNDVPSYG